jgi:hypothetical protein
MRTLPSGKQARNPRCAGRGSRQRSAVARRAVSPLLYRRRVGHGYVAAPAFMGCLVMDTEHCASPPASGFLVRALKAAQVASAG